jgi:hypothetical protein
MTVKAGRSLIRALQQIGVACSGVSRAAGRDHRLILQRIMHSVAAFARRNAAVMKSKGSAGESKNNNNDCDAYSDTAKFKGY